jgi:hypothetical protein
MIYANERMLRELDSISAQLASLIADLQAECDMLRAETKKSPAFLALEGYDSRFASAFTHIEKAKMAIRAIHPVCHQADFFKHKMVKKGRRR